MNRVNYFENIDTKEKAYILGFLAGDGYIASNINRVSATVAIKDKAVSEFISNEADGSYKENLSFNKKQRKFPSADVTIYSKKDVSFLLKMFGGRLKTERTLPRIRKDLEPYLVLGFFDAEGCITWGFRKDRGRLWQKVSFTSQQKMLVAVQNVLLKQGISTAIKPKGKEDCSVIEFSNEHDVFKFFKYLPQDSFRIKRKLSNYKSWLTAVKDKYSIVEGDLVSLFDKRTTDKFDIEEAYPKFSGFLRVIECSGDSILLENDHKYLKAQLRKGKTSLLALRLELDEIGENHV